MHKNFIRLAIIFVVLLMAYLLLFYVKDNKEVDKELNNAVKKLVKQVISVQYKTHSEDTMKEIFTEELVRDIDDYYYEFYRNELFYFIGNDYMQTLDYSEELKVGYVVLRVREGLISGKNFYLHIRFIQTEEGSYLISGIGRDI